MKEYNQEEMDDIIMKEIKNKTEDINIPESISPQSMMEKIKKEKERKRRFNRRVRTISAVLVASLVVVVGVIAYRESFKHHDIIELWEDKEIYKSQEDKPESFSSYKEINKFIKESTKEEYYFEEYYGDMMLGGSKGDAEVSVDGVVNGSVSEEDDSMGTGGDYTDTNIQVEGVNEADIVKTDGRYIYSYSMSKEGDAITIDIIEAKGIDTEEVSKIVIDAGKNNYVYGGEMYLYKNKLVVLYMIESWNFYENQTVINTYDISDIKYPKLIGEVKVLGDTNTSRMVDGMLYVFTNKVVGVDRFPEIDGERVKCNDIYKCEASEYDLYVTMSSIDISNPDRVIDTKCIITNYSNIYMSKENIYVLSQDNREKDGYYEEYTNIFKLTYKEGKFEPVANKSVDGEIRDQFAMDEYDGTLRILTTTDRVKINYDSEPNIGIVEDVIAFWGNDTSNNVYVLDKNLEVIGKITGLAKGERIYSARFDGEMGYFVTFRETDPVFAVDFSDKNNPKIVGELKIPGFSEYLHMWSENLMFGIGEEVDEKTGQIIGIKLSMFDVTDPENMVEVDKVVLEGDNWSEALYNHKALLINPNKNIIGFDVEGYVDEPYFTYMNEYYIYGYDKEKGFVQRGKVREGDEESNYKVAGYIRGINIEDYIYITYPGENVNVFDMNGNEVITTVDLE